MILQQAALLQVGSCLTAKCEEARTTREYNQRKSRKGALWEDPYFAFISRKLRRSTLPTGVFGISLTNSTCLGRL